MSRENDSVLKLNKSFYSDGSIKKAISDFSDVCKIKSEEDEKYAILLFEDDDVKTRMEFSNYVLSLEKVALEK